MSDLMTYADLANTLNEPIDAINRVFYHLHSVLDIPNEDSRPIRLLRLSFRDFILDSNRRKGDKAFFIDARPVHHQPFYICLRGMKNGLHQNMCNISHSGMRAKTISKVKVEELIPAPVQYACHYWIYHLQESKVDAVYTPEIFELFPNKAPLLG
jgi:hypothetical protein